MPLYICSNCGFGSASWLGRCPNCENFNTLKEQDYILQDSADKEATKEISLTPFKKIQSLKKIRLKTGIFEFDRVIGGGFVPGQVVLLTGEPGVGKSTLLLQILEKLKTVYISGEESSEQVKDRAERLAVKFDNFLFSDDIQIEGIIQGLEQLKDKIEAVVIDSIQTVYSKKIEGTPGSINQLKECTNKLIYFAKKTKIPVIIVGHITKGGEIAGPKTLEHAVDSVLNFEGEKISNFRLLRSSKNRFGPTDEIGIFEMKQSGLHQVTNPLIFVENKDQPQVGKAIVGTIEGKRSLFFEIQTLVVPTILPFPRRVVHGLDYNKVLLLLAVVKKYLGFALDKFDIYVNVVGGVDIKSTSSDLGAVAALISSINNQPLVEKSVFVGEVGLLGEVRKVYLEEKIITEAKRLGFKNIYSSSSIKNVKALKTNLHL